MKKIVFNISDSTYEKLRFEAMTQKKDIYQIIEDRIFDKPFSKEVEEAFEAFISSEVEKIMKE